MTLKEKLDYEYRRFYLDQMRTSRENIFAHSGEIECKKKIRDALSDPEFSARMEEDDAFRETILAQDGILESAFRFLQDEDGGCRRADDKEAAKRWVRFLLSS